VSQVFVDPGAVTTHTHDSDGETSGCEAAFVR